MYVIYRNNNTYFVSIDKSPPKKIILNSDEKSMKKTCIIEDFQYYKDSLNIDINYVQNEILKILKIDFKQNDMV